MPVAVSEVVWNRYRRLWPATLPECLERSAHCRSNGSESWRSTTFWRPRRRRAGGRLAYRFNNALCRDRARMGSTECGQLVLRIRAADQGRAWYCVRTGYTCVLFPRFDVNLPKAK